MYFLKTISGFVSQFEIYMAWMSCRTKKSATRSQNHGVHMPVWAAGTAGVVWNSEKINEQLVRFEASSRPVPSSFLAALWVKLDGLAMRRVPVRFGPLFLAHRERGQIGQTLCQSQPFERRQPMFVVMRAIIWLAASAGGSEFFPKSSGPLLPGEMSFFRKL